MRVISGFLPRFLLCWLGLKIQCLPHCIAFLCIIGSQLMQVWFLFSWAQDCRTSVVYASFLVLYSQQYLWYHRGHANYVFNFDRRFQNFLCCLNFKELWIVKPFFLDQTPFDIARSKSCWTKNGMYGRWNRRIERSKWESSMGVTESKKKGGPVNTFMIIKQAEKKVVFSPVPYHESFCIVLLKVRILCLVFIYFY